MNSVQFGRTNWYEAVGIQRLKWRGQSSIIIQDIFFYVATNKRKRKANEVEPKSATQARNKRNVELKSEKHNGNQGEGDISVTQQTQTTNKQNDVVTLQCEVKESSVTVEALLDCSSMPPIPDRFPKIARFHVYGEVLYPNDLDTLKGSAWLNDKVLNAFMTMLKFQQNRQADHHIFAFPSYLAVLWDNGSYSRWLFEKVKLSMFTWLFMPINVDNSHWVLLAAHVPTTTVSVLDSLKFPSSSKYARQWKTFMETRSNAVNELPVWTDGTLTSTRQRDGSSCGPFVMLNALALTNGLKLETVTQEHIERVRSYALHALLANAEKAPNRRLVCDALDCLKPRRKKNNWIGCEVCGRWDHKTCAQLDENAKSGYECIVCNAQYK